MRQRSGKKSTLGKQRRGRISRRRKHNSTFVKKAVMLRLTLIGNVDAKEENKFSHPWQSLRKCVLLISASVLKVVGH